MCPPPDDWEPGQLHYDTGDFTPNWIARTSLWLQLSNPCINDGYLPSHQLVNRAKPPRSTPRLNVKHAVADLVARQILRVGVLNRSCCREEDRDIIESLGPALSVKLEPALARKRNPRGSQLRSLRNPPRRLAHVEVRSRRPRKRSSPIARTSQAHRQRSSHHAPRIQHNHRCHECLSTQRRHAQAPKSALRKHLKFSAAPRVSFRSSLELLELFKVAQVPPDRSVVG